MTRLEEIRKKIYPKIGKINSDVIAVANSLGFLINKCKASQVPNASKEYAILLHTKVKHFQEADERISKQIPTIETIKEKLTSYSKYMANISRMEVLPADGRCSVGYILYFSLW